MRLALIIGATIAAVSAASAQSEFRPRYYFDAAGSPVGTAMQNNSNGIEFFYDRNGESVGTALPAGPSHKFFYGQDGQLLGSSAGPFDGDE